MDKGARGPDRFAHAGVRKSGYTRRSDDGQEVMILQEIEDEVRARRWIITRMPGLSGCRSKTTSAVTRAPAPIHGVRRDARALDDRRRAGELDVRLPVYLGVTSQVVTDLVANAPLRPSKIADACGAGADCGRCRRTCGPHRGVHKQDCRYTRPAEPA